MDSVLRAALDAHVALPGGHALIDRFDLGVFHCVCGQKVVDPAPMAHDEWDRALCPLPPSSWWAS